MQQMLQGGCFAVSCMEADSQAPQRRDGTWQAWAGLEATLRGHPSIYVRGALESGTGTGFNGNTLNTVPLPYILAT